MGSTINKQMYLKKGTALINIYADVAYQRRRTVSANAATKHMQMYLTEARELQHQLQSSHVGRTAFRVQTQTHMYSHKN
jgi:hypothetical protein